MNNLLDVLKTTLLKDKRLTIKGGLLKNKIIEMALKLDKDLIKLLLLNKQIKSTFFTEVDGTIVFDKDKFIKFISNKQFLPDSYTSFKNKVGLVTDSEYLSEDKSVVLAWPYKDCVLEGGMEKDNEDRDEVFFNQTLASDDIDRLLDPKVLTAFKRIDKDGEHEVKDFTRDPQGKIKDNLIIKGNNLLALHSLKKLFAGKIKLIYIDPPYNRDADSFYNDSFKRSTWLTFMKNRLEVAKQLLAEDGAIFVQIDDEQQAYLKVLCDEIFRKENYEVTIYIQVRYGEKTLSERNDYQKVIEQILVYKNPGFKPNKTTEEYSIEKFEWEIIEKVPGQKVKLGNRDAIIFKDGEYEIKKKKFSINALKETWASGSVLKTNASGKFFKDYIGTRVKSDGLNVLYKVMGIGEDGLGYRYFTGPKREGATKGKFYSGVPTRRVEELNNGSSLKELVIPNFYNLADYFGNCRQEGGVELRSGKKPEELLKIVLNLSTSKKDDIVLDFFLGTGTTAAVAHKMGKQYIGIEQLDYGKDDSEIRLKNVINGDSTGVSEEFNWNGGGSFIRCNLMKWNEIWADKIQKAKTSKELLQLWKLMQQKAFLNYKVNPQKFDDNVKTFEKLSFDNQKRFLMECIDKNQLYVNFSEINDEDYKVNENDKKLNKKFYNK